MQAHLPEQYQVFYREHEIQHNNLAKTTLTEFLKLTMQDCLQEHYLIRTFQDTMFGTTKDGKDEEQETE